MVRQTGRLLTGLLIVAAMAAASHAETRTPPRVVATYFHRTMRCQVCLQIEALAHYDIAKTLAASELGAGDSTGS